MTAKRNLHKHDAPTLRPIFDHSWPETGAAHGPALKVEYNRESHQAVFKVIDENGQTACISVPNGALSVLHLRLAEFLSPA